MENKSILTSEVIHELWGSHMFVFEDEDADEWFLYSCLRYGSITEMIEACGVALDALFVDNGRSDSSEIFEWTDSIVHDPKVFPFNKKMSEVIKLARKVFDAKMAEYRREGWLPQTYDVEYAFCGFMGLVNGIVYKKFYEKYENLQHLCSDVIYKTKGLFKKELNIISLSQFDNMHLREIVATSKYDRFDSAALLAVAEERNNLEDNHSLFIEEYVKIKNIILKSTGTLADIKHTLERIASTSKERDLYSYLFTSIVLELTHNH